MRDLSRREGVLRGLTQHWRAGTVSGRMGPSACSAIVRTADKPPYTLGTVNPLHKNQPRRRNNILTGRLFQLPRRVHGPIPPLDPYITLTPSHYPSGNPENTGLPTKISGAQLPGHKNLVDD